MRAIFYADWINLRGSLRVMLLTPAAFLAWALAIGEPIFFCVSLVVMGYLFPNTAFSVEESTGWNRLSLSLPVTRADVVNSRFVMAVLIHAVLAAVGAAFVPVGDTQSGVSGDGIDLGADAGVYVAVHRV